MALKRTIQFLLCLPILCLIYINYCLYYSPNWRKNDGNIYNNDVLEQLNYLKFQLHQKHAANEMQHMFPEGFVFTTALYGLAWADFANHLNKSTPLFQEAINELKWSINEVNSNQAKAIFTPNLPLKYGAYYTGWSTYLMGKYLILNPQDTTVSKLFNENCQNIKEAISVSKSPYLESYIGLAWPADNILCVASLALSEKIYPPQYKDIIDNWINRIKQYLDTETDLIPHSFNPETNEIGEGARGSSQSLMNCFLTEIDSNFAKGQFTLFKKYFIDKRLGLSAVLEYPIGIDKAGDVDSGPVIWGVGTAASIVAVRAMAVNNDSSQVPIRNSIEAFGFPNTFGEGKKYIFGVLPVADAFLAWSNAAENLSVPEPPFFWRGIFHLISLIIIIPFIWWIKKI